jgi:hypothetical protein
MRKFLLLIVVTIMTLGVAGTANAQERFPFDEAPWDASETQQRILLIGDSVVGQSAPTAVAIGEQRAHVVKSNALSGGSPCDFFPDYGRSTAEFAPTSVVISFVGNATNPCMVQAQGFVSPGVLSRAQINKIVEVYYQHLQALINWNVAFGVTTYLEAPPMMAPGTYHGQLNAGLVEAFKGLASRNPNTFYDDAARKYLSFNGQYAWTDAAGNPLRYQDGTHLRAPWGTLEHAKGMLNGPLNH